MDTRKRIEALIADGKQAEALVLLAPYWNPIAGIEVQTDTYKALGAVRAMICLAAERYGLEELAHYDDADMHEIDFGWRADEPNKCINVKVTIGTTEPKDDC
jgi:hypothetical protein